LALGLTPNAVTILGSLGSSLAAAYFFPKGRFFLGIWVVLFFVLSDLVDGTMARLSQSGGTKWGAFLDSSLDRATDGLLTACLSIYLYRTHQPILLAVTLGCIISSNLVSYVKARAESLALSCDGGFAERTERLIIFFVTLGLAGLGVKYALAIGLWILLIASSITVLQRLLIVHRQLR
jgi:CDP-diacylglycerol--glycerol-3-phosphate 3-phosphatidyltransferase